MLWLSAFSEKKKKKVLSFLDISNDSISMSELKFISLPKIRMLTSGQDGGIDRHTVPPPTTKRTTTNLNTKNNQNWQKIELGKWSLRTSDWKTCGGWGSTGRDSQPHRRVHWRDPYSPRMYTNPPTHESAPEGPNVIVGSRGSDWKPAESGASSIAPSQIPPPHTVSQCSHVGYLVKSLVGCPGKYLRLRPLLHNRYAKTKKKWPKWKNR